MYQMRVWFVCVCVIEISWQRSDQMQNYLYGRLCADCATEAGRQTKETKTKRKFNSADFSHFHVHAAIHVNVCRGGFGLDITK